MMGIPCDFPAYIYGDNQSILVNSSIPNSQLKKKSMSIAYHFVHEGVANEEWLCTYISSGDNPADILTKTSLGSEKQNHLIPKFLHHLGVYSS